MANSSPKRPSLSVFIEQTSRLLRNAVSSSKKTRIFTKKPLSPANKIEQIASMLRLQAKKTRSRKKK